MALNEKILLKNGFKKFHNNLKEDNKFYICSYQTKIIDNVGVKYFITCDHFNYSDYLYFQDPSKVFEYQFYINISHKKYNAIHIDLVQWRFNDKEFKKLNKTLQDVFDFFEEIWNTDNYEYYELTE